MPSLSATKERARVESMGPPEEPSHPSLLSPLRQWGYGVALVALAFIQSGGRMVADTKFDLLVHPWRFLTRGTHLWDANQAFGQVPDQSYGYAWPMGPFFLVGHLAHLPPWVIQSLWWGLLLCVAFFGMLRLLDRLQLGTELTQVVAAVAFVLTPRITTLVGVVSVEVWPMAVAPWVLLPLVRGSESGSVRRAAAMSALALVCAGGVNAVAVAALLPLGVLWILTRAPGPRRWRLLGWWTIFVGLATVWWTGPLLMMARFSPPFLDYIENATITTLPTDLTRTFLGINDWVAYFGGPDFRAGQYLVGTPYLLLDAAAIAALGLVGIGLSSNPHRRFLTLGVLTGLVLVGFGYSRDLAGFFAEDRRQLLDLTLAPLRNIHKFDVVLRVPLILGLAHALAELPRLLANGLALTRRVGQAAIGLVVVALLSPWLYTLIPPPDGVVQVPEYWQEAADYLAEHDDGTVALELPASSFGIYEWGNTHDDILQATTHSPWAVRSVVPLAQPGNVVFLDAVTRVVESGRPSDTLAGYLAANNVGTLVVRNDLNRVLTGAPDPAYVRSVLTRSPGLQLVRSFGPETGAPPFRYLDNAEHTRIVSGYGVTDRISSVELYRVVAPAQATVSSPGQVLVGDPASPVGSGWLAEFGAPHLLAADATASVTGQVLTDDMRRQEMNFPAVRWNESATMTQGEDFRLAGKEQTHRLVDDEDRWDTVATWSGGVTEVTASSSQAYADAVPPLEIGSHPGAVFDGDPVTAWVSARNEDADHQWWQAQLSTPSTVSQVSLGLRSDSVAVDRFAISGGGQTRKVDAPPPGQWETYSVGLPRTSTVRITAEYDGPLINASVVVSEVSIDDLHPQRMLTLPDPVAGAPVDAVVLSRDLGRLPCANIRDAFACDPVPEGPGEDGETLARAFVVPQADRYTVAATASLRRIPGVWADLLGSTGVSVETMPATTGDVSAAAGAMVDGDSSTTWIASATHPVVMLRLPKPTRLSRLDLTLNEGAAASQPARVELFAGDRHAVVDLDPEGYASLPRWRVERLQIKIDSTHPAFSEQGESYVELPPGITELHLNGTSPRSSVSGTFAVRCGSGPRINLSGSIYDTALTANVGDLVRGGSVPLRICGSRNAKTWLSGEETLVVGPTKALRVDSVTLVREGARFAEMTTLPVVREPDGAPTSVEVPELGEAQVLSLPQNENAGWVATLRGERLAPQRVDGWKQGWILPPGKAATVHLQFSPAGAFRAVLGLGALLLMAVVVSATPLRLGRGRDDLPSLTTGSAPVLDLVVVVAASTWLMGWMGVVLVALAIVGVRRWGDLIPVGGWGVPAAGSLLVASAALAWGPLKDRDWALTWAQGWAMVGVVCLSAVLLSAVGRSGPLAFRSARVAKPSGGSSA